MGSCCYNPNKNTFQVSMSVAFAEMAIFFLQLNLFYWHRAFSRQGGQENKSVSSLCIQTSLSAEFQCKYALCKNI